MYRFTIQNDASVTFEANTGGIIYNDPVKANVIVVGSWFDVSYGDGSVLGCGCLDWLSLLVCHWLSVFIK